MEPKPSHLSWLMRVSKGVRAIQTRGSDRVINRLLKDKWKQCVYMQQSLHYQRQLGAHMVQVVRWSWPLLCMVKKHFANQQWKTELRWPNLTSDVSLSSSEGRISSILRSLQMFSWVKLSLGLINHLHVRINHFVYKHLVSKNSYSLKPKHLGSLVLELSHRP